MTTTFSDGFRDLTDLTLNGLRIVNIAGRSPVIKWSVICNRCGSSWNEPHSMLVNGGARVGTCRVSWRGKRTSRADACMGGTKHRREMGKKPLLGGQIDLTGETFGNIDGLRLLKVRPCAAYEVKCRNCGSSWSGVTNQELTNNLKCINAGCSKRIFKTWKAELEHEQAEELRVLEEQYKRGWDELRKVQRKAVLSIKDDEFILSPETRSQEFTKDIPNEQAAMDFSGTEAEAFVKLHPEFLPSAHNHQQLTKFLLLNNAVNYVSRDDIERAYFRLLELGLLETRPKKPEPELPPERIPGTVEGFSVGTKTKYVRRYTPAEASKMSASEYRKAIVDYDEEMRRKLPESQPAIDPDELVYGYSKDGSPLALSRRQIDALPADEYKRFLLSAGESDGLTTDALTLCRKHW